MPGGLRANCFLSRENDPPFAHLFRVLLVKPRCMLFIRQRVTLASMYMDFMFGNDESFDMTSLELQTGGFRCRTLLCMLTLWNMPAVIQEAVH